MPVRRVWTQERINEAASLRNRGFSNSAIAQRMGLTTVQVAQGLHRHGSEANAPIQHARRNTWTEDMFEELRIQRDAGESTQSLADHFQVSVDSIYYRLRQLREMQDADANQDSETISSNGKASDEKAISEVSDKEEAADDEADDDEADDDEVDDRAKHDTESLDSNELRRARRLRRLHRFAARTLAAIRAEADSVSSLSSLSSETPTSPSTFMGTPSSSSAIDESSGTSSQAGTLTSRSNLAATESSEAGSASHSSSSHPDYSSSARESASDTPPRPPGLTRWLNAYERRRREEDEREEAERLRQEVLSPSELERPSTGSEVESEKTPSSHELRQADGSENSRRSDWTPADDDTEEIRKDERSPTPDQGMLAELS